jgi:hypothetical protein
MLLCVLLCRDHRSLCCPRVLASSTSLAVSLSRVFVAHRFAVLSVDSPSMLMLRTILAGRSVKRTSGRWCLTPVTLLRT